MKLSGDHFRNGSLFVLVCVILWLFIQAGRQSWGFLPMPHYSNGLKVSLVKERTQTAFQVDNFDKIVGYTIQNASSNTIHSRIKINDYAKSSMDDLLAYVGNEGSTKEQAIRWTEYMYNNRKWGSRLMANSEFSNPLLFFVNGGYGICSDFARAMAIGLTRQNVRARIVHIGGVHAVTEVWYDEAWHMFDPSEGVYFVDVAGTILSVDQLLKNPKYTDQMLSVWGRDQWNKDFIKDVYSNYKIMNFEYADSFMFHFQDETVAYTLEPDDKLFFFTVGKTKIC